MSKARLRQVLEKSGGEKGLRTILQDFYQRLSQDIMVGYFFAGKDVKSIAEMQGRFMLYAAGLQSVYPGKLPTSAHLELPPILKGHFDRRLLLLRETLQNHGLSAEEIEIWIEFENAFRNVVEHS